MFDSEELEKILKLTTQRVSSSFIGQPISDSIKKVMLENVRKNTIEALTPFAQLGNFLIKPEDVLVTHNDGSVHVQLVGETCRMFLLGVTKETESK